jgi:predicted nucleic acid-binding protein
LTAFADSSFLFSLYAQDANSAAAIARVKYAVAPLLSTDLGELEITNGVALRLFRKELRPIEARSVLDLFRKDIETGVVRIIPLPSSAYQQVAQIAARHTPALGTRTLDVLQVVSALVLKADTFFTFDQKQAKLASALGLRVS